MHFQYANQKTEIEVPLKSYMFDSDQSYEFTKKSLDNQLIMLSKGNDGTYTDSLVHAISTTAYVTPELIQDLEKDQGKPFDMTPDSPLLQALLKDKGIEFADSNALNYCFERAIANPQVDKQEAVNQFVDLAVTSAQPEFLTYLLINHEDKLTPQDFFKSMENAPYLEDGQVYFNLQRAELFLYNGYSADTKCDYTMKDGKTAKTPLELSVYLMDQMNGLNMDSNFYENSVCLPEMLVEYGADTSNINQTISDMDIEPYNARVYSQEMERIIFDEEKKQNFRNLSNTLMKEKDPMELRSDSTAVEQKSSAKGMKR